MSTSAITPTPSVAVGSVVYAGANPKAGRTNLDQADFMKLLTTQLSAQDPMNPMKDTEFISQMANFTALQNSKTLSESFTSFSAQQAMSSAPAYLGKYVTVKDLNGTGGLTSGIVDEVVLADGTPSLVIGGKNFATSMVTGIASAAPTTL
ncbi:MAG: flagellar hook capping FlgD N-terminal domain-containing protein [Verrucomicrobiae bacterium]